MDLLACLTEDGTLAVLRLTGQRLWLLHPPPRAATTTPAPASTTTTSAPFAAATNEPAAGAVPVAIAWRPDGRALAVGCADGTVRLLDPEHGAPLTDDLTLLRPTAVACIGWHAAVAEPTTPCRDAGRLRAAAAAADGAGIDQDRTAAADDNVADTDGDDGDADANADDRHDVPPVLDTDRRNRRSHDGGSAGEDDALLCKLLPRLEPIATAGTSTAAQTGGRERAGDGRGGSVRSADQDDPGGGGAADGMHVAQSRVLASRVRLGLDVLVVGCMDGTLHLFVHGLLRLYALSLGAAASPAPRPIVPLCSVLSADLSVLWVLGQAPGRPAPTSMPKRATLCVAAMRVPLLCGRRRDVAALAARYAALLALLEYADAVLHAMELAWERSLPVLDTKLAALAERLPPPRTVASELLEVRTRVVSCHRARGR